MRIYTTYSLLRILKDLINSPIGSECINTSPIISILTIILFASDDSINKI